MFLKLIGFYNSLMETTAKVKGDGSSKRDCFSSLSSRAGITQEKSSFV